MDQKASEWDDGLLSRGDMIQAQLVYFGIALIMTVTAYRNQFLFRSSTTYYDAGDVLPANYWKYLNMTINYYTIGWMGIAAFVQLLKIMFGFEA